MTISPVYKVARSEAQRGWLVMADGEPVGRADTRKEAEAHLTVAAGLASMARAIGDRRPQPSAFDYMIIDAGREVARLQADAVTALRRLERDAREGADRLEAGGSPWGVRGGASRGAEAEVAYQAYQSAVEKLRDLWIVAREDRAMPACAVYGIAGFFRGGLL